MFNWTYIQNRFSFFHSNVGAISSFLKTLWNFFLCFKVFLAVKPVHFAITRMVFLGFHIIYIKMIEDIMFQFSECPLGYFGDNCTNICPSSYYGRVCVHKCECSPCHHIYGCVSTTLIRVAGQSFLVLMKMNKLMIFSQNVQSLTKK